jgi:hypothetical protein
MGLVGWGCSLYASSSKIDRVVNQPDKQKVRHPLVAEDYPVPNTFTGEVNWVEIDVRDAAADADHMLDPDELLRVAMARQ